MKRYLIFGIWGGKTPPHREKALSGVKFRSAKCPIDWTNRSGKTSDYSRGCREMRRGLSAQGGFCGVQTSAQNHPVYSVLSPRGDKSRRKISTFLHKMKKPGAVPSCYVYFVVSGSDSAAIAVFIPSLNPCSKAFFS